MRSGGSVGFEREKARRIDMNTAFCQRTIDKSISLEKIILGFSITAVCFAFYYYFAIHLGQVELGRTLTFGALILSQVFLILINRMGPDKS